MMNKLDKEMILKWLELEEAEFYIDKFREKHEIAPDSDNFYKIIERLCRDKILKRLSRGLYKKIKKIEPVQVYGQPRERKPVVKINFPRTADTEVEMDFAKHIVFREGDLITIGGVKSKGKTTLCLSLCAENIDSTPVLMGHEYTVLVNERNEPSPRFLNKLDRMKEWAKWTDDKGYDRFILLPVWEDYEEYIVPGKINIIDWVDLDGDRLYDIGKVLKGIKAKLGGGIAIVALQKKEGAANPRGDQFVRDYSDLEIILDGFGSNEDDILLTVRGAKEKTAPIIGKTYAYTISGGGTQISNFREVVRCSSCRGKGYDKDGECHKCKGNKYIDKDDIPF